MKNYLKIILSISLVVLLQSCSTTGNVKKPKSVHGDKPLIDTSEIIKKGQKMAFITASDGTCSLDNITMFSDEWTKYQKDLTEGQIVLLIGNRDIKRGSFIIKSISKIKNLV